MVLFVLWPLKWLSSCIYYFVYLRNVQYCSACVYVLSFHKIVLKVSFSFLLLSLNMVLRGWLAFKNPPLSLVALLSSADESHVTDIALHFDSLSFCWHQCKSSLNVLINLNAFFSLKPFLTAECCLLSSQCILCKYSRMCDSFIQ